MAKPPYSQLRPKGYANSTCSGRADWLWMDEEGRVTTYINQRGVSKTMIPYWYKASNDGVTHTGMGKDVGEDRRQVIFGRLFGSGRADVRPP